MEIHNLDAQRTVAMARVKKHLEICDILLWLVREEKHDGNQVLKYIAEAHEHTIKVRNLNTFVKTLNKDIANILETNKEKIRNE